MYKLMERETRADECDHLSLKFGVSGELIKQVIKYSVAIW